VAGNSALAQAPAAVTGTANWTSDQDQTTIVAVSIPLLTVLVNVFA